tara:strand:+ start:1127 stop:1441 length:315 start_codon:yes stop_codon:yes gene_type:complete
MSEGKCWWRYNNNGGRYKTCENNQYKKGVGKKPVEVSRLTPEEFVEKLGVDYSDMKKPQRNEYHRLDMAERRKQERKAVAKILVQRQQAKKKKQNKKKAVLDKK